MMPPDDSRNAAGASTLGRLLLGSGPREKLGLRAGSWQGLQRILHCRQPGVALGWRPVGGSRAIKNARWVWVAMTVLALTVIAYVAMPPTSTNRISAAWSNSGSR